ncbi:MAG: protein kinase [Myxococcales bacterium]|nr:protein kinase [Myxococcales bacterium]
MLQPGQVVAGHTIGEQLGEGPLTATWLVEGAGGTITGVLRLLLVRLPDFRARFQGAAEVLMGLRHPNLVRLRDFVEVDGLVGVVSEYVEGGNLGAWSKRGARSAERMVPVFYQMAQGVGAAHDAGLLHRNLKPTKVLVTRAGVPKVAGFALGKASAQDLHTNTEVGTTFGTPQYMPPEQFRGVAGVDVRADLFAMGCVLYEMLTGKRAFGGDDLLQTYKAVHTSSYDPLPAGVPAGLVGIVADLLDPDPDQRPSSVADLLARMHEDPEIHELVASIPEPVPEPEWSAYSDTPSAGSSVPPLPPALAAATSLPPTIDDLHPVDPRSAPLISETPPPMAPPPEALPQGASEVPSPATPPPRVAPPPPPPVPPELEAGPHELGTGTPVEPRRHAGAPSLPPPPGLAEAMPRHHAPTPSEGAGAAYSQPLYQDAPASGGRRVGSVVVPPPALPRTPQAAGMPPMWQLVVIAASLAVMLLAGVAVVLALLLTP